MSRMIELIQGGGVTSPRGFLAGGTYAGIKTAEDGAMDLAILVSEQPASVGGVFTQNKVVSPSVILSRERVSKDTLRGVVVNSGCANCSVGSQGLSDAEEMTSLAAKHIGCDTEDMLVCSTGMIGVELPMALVRQNIGNISCAVGGGNDFAKAIMTTDTHPKEMALSLDTSGRKIMLGGAAKGAAMLHPNMATMLSFITTDANVESQFLQSSLEEAVAASFNMIDVDGDTSTNDTVLVFANGLSGGQRIDSESADATRFKEALTYICTGLAKELVRDGEGSQRLIEVVVKGAVTVEEARWAAREIASSVLVKAMVHGRDPNWGRIMVALGKSGVGFEESKVDLYINDIHIVHNGTSFPYLKDAVISAMNVPEIRFRIDLNCGDSSGTAWGCDLTEDYVTLNSAYST